MNKLFTKIAGLSLGLAMAIGVGVAVGSKEASKVEAAATAHEHTFTSSMPTGWTNGNMTANNTYYKADAGDYVELAASTMFDTGNVLNGNVSVDIACGTFGTWSGDKTATFTVSFLNSSGTVLTTANGTTGQLNSTATTYRFSSSAIVLNAPTDVTAISKLRVTVTTLTSTSSGCLRFNKVKLTYDQKSSGGSAAVTGVSLNKNSTSIDVGDTETLTATVSPNDAADKSVTWKSYSDSACTTESSAVASVSSSGVVTGVSAGTAYIQVKTTDGNYTAKCTVTVTMPTYTDTYSLNGQTRAVKASNDGYIINSIGTSGRAGVTTSSASAATFLFTIVGHDTFTLKLTNGTNAGKFLTCTGSTGGSSVTKVDTTAMNWTVETDSGNIHLKDTNSHYLAANGTSDWRMYANTSYGYPNLSFPTISSDPEITDVSLSGSPAASATIGGGNSWKMSATVTTINDPSTTLSRNVNWTVSPSGAVTFSKTTSASEEEITVTAVNAANNNVVITASSAATGFTTVHGDSNSFNIIKSYVVSNVTLSATTAGGPTYDADGASSFVVGFTTAVIYSGDAGTSKVNITVSPSAGVSGYGDNVTAGAFDLTFTKSGTYSVTSTSIENNTKYQTVSVTINNIVVPGYEKATSASALRNNAKLVIGSSAKGVLMKNAAASAAIGNTSYTVSDDFIPEDDLPNDAVEFTLHTSNEYWELTAVISSTTYYLEYDASKQSNGNSASYASASSNLTKWSITFTNTGDVNLVPSTADSRSLRCNTSNSNFACYAGTQSTIQMYIKIDTSPYFSINETTLYLGPRGTSTLTLTAHNGASDTITWASSDTDIATVSPSSGLSTVVTGVAEGDITITATFTKAEFDTISVAVHVIPLDTYVNIGVTTFTKVTSTPAGGWDGTYLLVDETASEIFDGSASPLVADATKSVTISSSSITATNSMISSSFNIKTSTNGYTLKSNSNHYVGNRSTSNGISTSVGVEYEVSIGSDGTVTALLEDGTSSGTTLRHNASAQNNIWRFYTGSTGNDMVLYKADGEMRAISDTLTDFYDAVKENEYLVCNASGTGSKVDFDGIVDCTGDLTSEDYDTLKRMTAKSAEDNGNYLEDLISDYDYLVQFKGQTDIFGRFDVGGAMYGHTIVRNHLQAISKNAGTTIAIVIISAVSLAAIGGYFLFRKKKEN